MKSVTFLVLPGLIPLTTMDPNTERLLLDGKIGPYFAVYDIETESFGLYPISSTDNPFNPEMPIEIRAMQPAVDTNVFIAVATTTATAESQAYGTYEILRTIMETS